MQRHALRASQFQDARQCHSTRFGSRVGQRRGKDRPATHTRVAKAYRRTKGNLTENKLFGQYSVEATDQVAIMAHLSITHST